MTIAHIIPSYADLDIALTIATCDVHPSEAHGLITGFICSLANVNTHPWLNFILQGQNYPALNDQLQNLMIHTLQEMQRSDYVFTLFLPDDNADIDERVAALALWCQGFLTALNHCQQLPLPKPNQKPNNETEELLHDLIEIAQASYTDQPTTEDEEQSYAELVEYVRIAVIYIYQELRGQETHASSSPKKHLH